MVTIAPNPVVTLTPRQDASGRPVLDLRCCTCGAQANYSESNLELAVAVAEAHVCFVA